MVWDVDHADQPLAACRRGGGRHSDTCDRPPTRSSDLLDIDLPVTEAPPAVDEKTDAAALNSRLSVGTSSGMVERSQTHGVAGYSTIVRQGRGCGAGEDTGCGAGGIDIVGMGLSGGCQDQRPPRHTPVGRRDQSGASGALHQRHRLFVCPLISESVRTVEDGDRINSGKGDVPSPRDVPG
jgi:hypothetical protein